MKNLLLLIPLIFILGFKPAIAQQETYHIEIDNEQIVGNDYFFDVFIYHGTSQDGHFYLGGPDIVFTYDVSSVSSPVLTTVESTPAPPFFLQIGYCTFTPQNYPVETSLNAILVQNAYHNNTSTAIAGLTGELLVISVLLPSVSNTDDVHSRIPQIGCVDNTMPEKNRLGRFKLSSNNPISANPNLQLKTVGAGQKTKLQVLNQTTLIVSEIPYTNMPCPILPIELVKFTAERSGDFSLLEWTTATEIDHSHFEIERSNDALNWENIGQQSSQGNTTEVQNYSFWDRLPLPNTNYYRLKSIDQDGSFEYSDIRVVEMGERTEDIKIFPNPAYDKVLLTFKEATTNSQILLLDASGREMYRLDHLAEGQFSQEIPLDGLAAGVYFLKVKNDRDTQVVRLMKL